VAALELKSGAFGIRDILGNGAGNLYTTGSRGCSQAGQLSYLRD
jgi:hypothetical protein